MKKYFLTTALASLFLMSCQTKKTLGGNPFPGDDALYAKYKELIKENKKNEKQTVFIINGKHYSQDQFRKGLDGNSKMNIISIKDESQIKNLGYSPKKVNRILVINKL